MPAHAATCHYTGQTSYHGQVTAIVTDIETPAGLVIDVHLRLDATPWLVWPVQFLIQERSTYRNGTLQAVEVNGRWSSNGTIRRQYWDVLSPGPTGLNAYRIQVKRQADLQRRNPPFASYWNPATFTQPWLQPFTIAAPDRRPDLDLPTTQIPPNLKSPLALAFYWSRQPLPGPTIPIFLPGWKHDARLTGTLIKTGATTRLTLPHPNLTPDSYIEVTQNPHTLHLQAETTAGDGEATLTQTGCNPN